MTQIRSGELRDALEVALRRSADPLVRARALQDLRRQLEDVEVEVVDDAYRRFTSWAKIGAAFGVRKQSIWAKHHHRHR